MTLVAQRDGDAIRAGLTEWLRARRGEATPAVDEVVRPPVGFSAETWIARLTDGEQLVLRLPPVGEGLFPEYDLGAQARTQTALARGGLPVPEPIAFETDERFLGAPFVAMPFVPGNIPGQAPVMDPWVMEATPEEQRALCHELVDILAAVHRFDWQAARLGDVLRGHGATLVDEVDWWDRYLGWAFSGAPPAALVSSLTWCREHVPDEEPEHALLWGDVRLGNVIFDDERRAVAVLDWEMSTIGPPELDLGWYLALEDAQRELAGGVPGFPGRDELIARYESNAKRAVLDVGWYEIFALVRSNAVMLRIGALFEAAGGKSFAVDGNPMIALAERRIAESSG